MYACLSSMHIQTASHRTMISFVLLYNMHVGQVLEVVES